MTINLSKEWQKMNKKTISLILSAFLMLGAMAGCSTGSSTVSTVSTQSQVSQVLERSSKVESSIIESSLESSLKEESSEVEISEEISKQESSRIETSRAEPSKQESSEQDTSKPLTSSRPETSKQESSRIETSRAESSWQESSFSTGNSQNSNPFNTYDNPEQQNTTKYVLNTSTMKIHKSSCSYVKKIAPENYATTADLTGALAQGYEKCKKCW